MLHPWAASPPNEKQDILLSLLGLASNVEQVDRALSEVAGLETPEAKAAYLELVTDCAITSRIGGSTEDDFWALAESLVAGEIWIKSAN